jgi:DNA polymerase-3 subunit epsilon
MSWIERIQHTLFGRDFPEPTRWIMLDVETSGLNIQSDRLLAIAAIAMQVDWHKGTLGVLLGDSFEVVLGHEEVSNKENILLHGIGAQQQREGLAPVLAMQSFAAYAGSAPLLAFHAAFDQGMINRYTRQFLGQTLSNPWLDIDHLCAVTCEGVNARALDDWMSHFGIHCAVRHQAAADTLAECELLQFIWPKVRAQCTNWTGMERLAKQHRWLPRAGR